MERQIESIKDKKAKKDYEVLHKMVEILQRYIVQATNKVKQLHSLSTKHAEQIIDLEKCIKKKMGSTESLQNNYNTLQKQVEDFQLIPRKQL